MVTGKEAWTELQRMKHAAGQPLGMKLLTVFVAIIVTVIVSLSPYAVLIDLLIYLLTYCIYCTKKKLF